MERDPNEVRLSRKQVANLCNSPQRAHQIGFLRYTGIPHRVGPDGWPVVLWCDLDPVHERVAESRAWKSRKVA